MSFSLTGAHSCVVLFYLVYPFIWAGACAWVMDTAGHDGGSILQGLSCWPTVGLFWARDPHLQQMLLTYITKLHLATVKGRFIIYGDDRVG